MEAHEPPVRIVAIGTVYRRDNLDLTHTPMFHQFEGLVVGEASRSRDLKGTLTAFVRELFAPDTQGAASARASSPTPSRAPRCSSAACSASGSGLPGVQAHRLARDPRQRHGAPGGLRGGRLRPRALHRLCVRHRASSGWRCSSTAWTTSGCSTRTTCASWSSSPCETPRSPGSVSSSTCRPAGADVASTLSMRGFEVASVDRFEMRPAPATTRSSTSRSPPTGPTA